MKVNLKRAFLAMMSFLLVSSLFGQREKNLEWFGRGSSVINLLQGVDYSSLSNSESEITYNNLNINLRANYFVTDKIGVIAGIHTKNSVNKFKANDSETKNNYTLFEVGGMYGFQPEFLNHTPISAQLTFGFGGADYSGTKNGLFATEISVSSYHPINESGLHLSPTLGYGFLNQSFKESDAAANSNGFFAGITLVKPFSCDEYLCALDEDEAPSNLYQSGTNIINFSQSGLFSTGLTKFKDSDFEFNTTNFDLRLADYHYVLDNFAVGASLNLETQTRNLKQQESKSTTTSFTFMPMVRYHVPVEGPLNHLYADAGFGFGSSNTTSIFMGNETKTKNGVTGYEFNLGYNIPFTDRLSFSIQGGYASKTTKDKDSDSEDKRDGFSMLYGLSFVLVP